MKYHSIKFSLFWVLLILIVLVAGVSTSFAVPPVIYWREMNGDIRKANFDGTEQENIIASGYGYDLEIDFSAGTIYWGQHGVGLRRCNLDGSNVETIVAQTTAITSIGLDLVSSKVYYAVGENGGSPYGEIRSADLDGGNNQQIRASCNNNIYGLYVSPKFGKIYWTQGYSGVYSAELDASNVTQLHNSGGEFTPGLVVDEVNRHIFFDEYSNSKIFRMDLDGSNKSLFLSTPVQPYSMAIDFSRNLLFYGSYSSKTVHKCNLNDGSNNTLILTGTAAGVGLAYPTTPPEPIFNEDTIFTFIVEDFYFPEVNAALFTKLELISAVTKGVLYIDANDSDSYDAGEEIITGSEVSKAQIDAGNLQFKPDANENGTPYTSFTFDWHNGTAFAGDNLTMNINVNPVNDAPAALNSSVTTPEDTDYTFAPGDFGFSDVDDGDALVKIQIVTLVTLGSLKLDGSDVTENQEIAVTDISKLKFTPNGHDDDSFNFKVNDGDVYSDNIYTMTIVSVQAPTGGGNGGCFIATVAKPL